MKILNNLAKRPILAIASILIITFLFCFSVSALNITKNNLSIYEKSDGVTINNPEALEENGVITPDITFSQLEDFVTFKLTLSSDDDSAYQIINISDNNANKNIAVSYSYNDAASDSEKDIYITLTYKNESANDLNLTNFEVTIDYEEEDVLDVPNTSSASGPDAPDTGSQTFSKTFTLENQNKNGSIVQTILPIILVCTLASLLYLLFRQFRQTKDFSLTKLSHSRQVLQTFVGLAITGLIIAGGAIGITHATDNNSVKLSFNLSKVKIAPASTTRKVQLINNAPSIVTNIQDTIKTCNLEADETACEIVLPSFTVIPGHEALGWNTNKDAQEALYQPGQTVSFAANTTLYTITRGEFSASFVNQHDTHFNISSESNSCYVYNSAPSCQVATPTASKKSATDGSEFLGWHTDATSTTPAVAAGEPVHISKDTAFYSIASIPPTIISVQFINQDPSGISISQTSTTCTIPSNGTTCDVVLPTITANSGYEALGWSKSSSLTSATYSAGQTVAVSSSETFYTISRKTLTATFTNLHSEYFNISSTSESCYVYNGITGGCVISAPTITKLSSDANTTFLGWNTNPNTRTGMESSSSIIIYDSNTYYSIAKVPTDTVYSLEFSNDIWKISTETPLSYFSTSEDCSRSHESYCIEVKKYCTVYTWESSCTIKAPEFSVASGWEAYGYDTKHPLTFNDPADKTTNFTEIGKIITVSSNNNGTEYYNLIRSENSITAIFTNQHTAYLTSSSDSESCYLYNNNGSCSITTPTLTPKETNNTITKLAWSKDPTKYQGEVTAGQPTNISKDTTFYSSASGIAYTITFDKNVSFEGSDPTGCRTEPQTGGCDHKQNNIAADSLSFYQTKCTVTSTGCYLANLPRIYSTSNSPLGFSLSQYGDASIIPLLDYNFTADTTVYARVTDRANVTTNEGDPVRFNATTKVYEPGSSTEYYQVDFDEDLKEELVDYYGPYIERVFQNAPQLFALRGKMRFFSRDHYVNYFGGSLAHVATVHKLYSPIEFSPNNSNAVEEYSKTAIVHEFGHAIDAAWGELYGTNGSGLYGLSSQPDIRAIHDYYKEKRDNGEQVPLRSYGSYVEFFGDAFAVWYRKKSGMTQESAHGYITEDIEEILDNYLCNPEYDKIPYISSSPVCGNGEIVEDVVYN